MTICPKCKEVTRWPRCPRCPKGVLGALLILLGVTTGGCGRITHVIDLSDVEERVRRACEYEEPGNVEGCVQRRMGNFFDLPERF